MTTIVYNHKDKEIAVDGRSTTASGLILDDQTLKYTTYKDVTFIFSGAYCDNDLLVDAYFGKEIKYVPECLAFIIENGFAYKIGIDSNKVLWKERLTCNDSIGTGAAFALAALDFNLNTKEAIKYVSTRDVFTGGKITVLNVA